MKMIDRLVESRTEWDREVVIDLFNLVVHGAGNKDWAESWAAGVRDTLRWKAEEIDEAVVNWVLENYEAFDQLGKVFQAHRRRKLEKTPEENKAQVQRSLGGFSPEFMSDLKSQ